MAVDPGQNIWVTEGFNTGTQMFVIPNVGTVTSPAYNTTQSATYTGTGFTTTNLNTTFTGDPYGIAIDSSNNAWVNTNTTSPGVYKVVPTLSGTQVAAVPSSPTTVTNPGTATTPKQTEVDGSGIVWWTDNGGSNQGPIAYNPATSTYITPTTGLKPCVITSTTCTYPVNNATAVRIDSTGSIWVLNSATTTGAVMMQVIGTANPTWPWLGTGKPGVEPQ